MKRKTIIKGKKFSIWIINFCILGLILTSIFPLISVPENDALKEDLYFDFEMMKNSNNHEINSLVDDVNLINLIFWAIISLGLISLFCITFLTFLTRWYLYLLTIISMAIFIFSILLVIFQYNFIEDVADIDFISLSSVSYTITYVHIIFLFSIFLLICSFLYSVNIILDLGSKIHFSKSKKQLLKKNKDQPADYPIKPIFDDQISQSPIPIIKKENTVRWINQEKQKVDKKTEEDIYTPKKEVMTPIETTSEEKSYVNNKIAAIEKKIQPGPFAPEKREEKPKESTEPEISKSFEKALSSAIEKKQSEFGKRDQKKPMSKEIIKDSAPNLEDESSEPAQNKDVEKEEGPLNKKDTIKLDIIVKCPQCNHIFTIKKDDTTKIKCPRCGKEGIAQ